MLRLGTRYFDQTSLPSTFVLRFLNSRKSVPDELDPSIPEPKIRSDEYYPIQPSEGSLAYSNLTQRHRGNRGYQGAAIDLQASEPKSSRERGALILTAGSRIFGFSYSLLLVMVFGVGRRKGMPGGYVLMGCGCGNWMSSSGCIIDLQIILPF